MGDCYKHVEPADRLVIYELLFKGISVPGIAQKLGFHKATLYRELERNSCKYGYRPDWASQQALIRQKKRRDQASKVIGG